MTEKYIYNLEFPPYITEFKIGDYLFKRVSDYSNVSSGLQHLVDTVGSEYPTRVQTGSHQITAVVEIPDNEKSAFLPWEDKNATQIVDVLLLLSLFTGRNVFTKDWEGEEGKAIMADYRQHQWGGQLHVSIEYESAFKHKDTGELKKDESDIEEVSMFDYELVDIGFEKGVNKVLDLISSQKWQEEYSCGYFLLLFKQAIQRQIIETSFIVCWSIWEHIFTLHHKEYLDVGTMQKMSGYEKIAFILSKYFIIPLDAKSKVEIKRLVNTRNRIVHFGMKADNVDYKEMDMFIRFTEQLMAIILGLKPSNIFNSTEKLSKFLKI